MHAVDTTTYLSRGVINSHLHWPLEHFTSVNYKRNVLATASPLMAELFLSKLASFATVVNYDRKFFLTFGAGEQGRAGGTDLPGLQVRDPAADQEPLHHGLGTQRHSPRKLLQGCQPGINVENFLRPQFTSVCNELQCLSLTSLSGDCIFSRVRPFYEEAVSDLDP
jgi:hypothetical protein